MRWAGTTTLVLLLPKFYYPSTYYPSTWTSVLAGDSSTVKIISRFSKAVDIFKATNFKQGTAAVGVELRIRKVIKATYNFPRGDATAWLTTFSNLERDRDWTTSCLAHGFTYSDFSGILGLAWTAYPDSARHNGGICQAAGATLVLLLP